MEILDEYKKVVELLISKINGKYSIVTFLTIDEILKDEVNLKSIWWELSRMNDSNRKQYNKLGRELERLSEEEYDDWGYRVQDEADDLNNLVDYKIMSLQSLIDVLENVKDLEDDGEISNYFQDIKPMDI
jgi:hypothetical protein